MHLEPRNKMLEQKTKNIEILCRLPHKNGCVSLRHVPACPPRKRRKTRGRIQHSRKPEVNVEEHRCTSAPNRQKVYHGRRSSNNAGRYGRTHKKTQVHGLGDNMITIQSMSVWAIILSFILGTAYACYLNIKLRKLRVTDIKLAY